MSQPISHPYKIGLALGSGGARGLAHIGVIKALEENHIPIDVIAGSSAGSLVGGLYAKFGSIAKVEAIAQKFSYKDLVMVFADIGTKSGLIRGNKLESYLTNLLEAQTIESLRLPFAAVATDIHSGNPAILRHGSLATAIRASSSIPALVDAIHIDTHYLCDGGESEPVPVKTAKLLGATYVIAVNLDVYNFSDTEDSAQKKSSVVDMGIKALQLLRFNLARECCRNANITITPDVASTSSVNLIQFVHGEHIIQKGYEATLKVIPKIKKSIRVSKFSFLFSPFRRKI